MFMDGVAWVVYIRLYIQYIMIWGEEWFWWITSKISENRQWKTPRSFESEQQSQNCAWSRLSRLPLFWIV